MSRALADHDAFARAAVKSHHGTVVKMTGDGMHAVFGDPVDALTCDVAAAAGARRPGRRPTWRALHVRCGLPSGRSSAATTTSSARLSIAPHAS